MWHYVLETWLFLIIIGESLDRFYSKSHDMVQCHIILCCVTFCYCVGLCVIVIVYSCAHARVCVRGHERVCVCVYIYICVCESVCV